MTKHRIQIGIDPGRLNGWAEWDREKGDFVHITTIQGIATVFEYIFTACVDNHGAVHFSVEDARLISGSPERSQGAGSVKAICREIEDYLIRLQKQQFQNMTYEMGKPVKNGTKLNEHQFRLMTGWPHRTSSHGRDAACRVYQT